MKRDPGEYRVVCENRGVRVDPGELLRTCAEAGAELLVCVDSRGEEIPGIGVVHRSLGGGLGIPEGRRNAYTFLVAGSAGYSTERQRSEAERFRDRIADRILHPERVPEDKKQLIQDDLLRVDRVLALPYGRRILEVGCSDGTVSVRIARKPGVAAVLGVDILPAAIQDARTAAREEPEEVRRKLSFLALPIEQLRMRRGSFDTVCAFETIEHLGTGQVEPALRTFAEVLAEDGWLLATVPNRYPARRYESEGRARWRWDNHNHYFTPVSLRHLLGGFFEEVRLHPFLPGEPVEEGIYLIAECRRPARLGEGTCA